MGQSYICLPTAPRFLSICNSSELPAVSVDTDDDPDELLMYSRLAVGPRGVAFPLLYAKRCVKTHNLGAEAR